MNNVKIMGADQSVTNSDATDYLRAVQASASRAKLFKLSISPLAGMAADVFVWVFDLAAGTTASVNPVLVRYVPAGLADTWDFGPDGAVFTNGIYITTSTVEPTNPTTTITTSGDNKVILKADLRKY